MFSVFEQDPDAFSLREDVSLHLRGHSVPRKGFESESTGSETKIKPCVYLGRSVSREISFHDVKLKHEKCSVCHILC